MPPHPHPLRTALIGLSSSAATSWAAAAHLPALLSPPGRSKLALTALLNSSVSAAKSAVATYNLPPSTKTYGSPEDLALDPDIDLVICNTRVDTHYDVIIPSIRAGKDVFVEWPIARTKAQIDDIIAAARESGARVAVGLQRRWNPIVAKARQVVQEGELGKLLNVEARQFGATNDRDVVPSSLRYFLEREVGGNVVTIGVGHALDTLLSVVGDVDPETLHAKSQIQRPQVRIRDPSTSEIIETAASDVPDYLSFNARLAPSPHTAENATLSYIFRRGQPFPGTPLVSWTLNFERGEIRLQSPRSGFFDADPEDEEKVGFQVHYHEDGRVEDVEWGWSGEQAALPLAARLVSSTVFAFADGREAGDGWVGVEDAARRAELVGRLLDA